MIEITEVTSDKMMVYVTIDEKDAVNRLFKRKPPTGIYYAKKHKIGYHWLVHPITASKLFGHQK